MYASTGDQRLKAKGDAVVAGHGRVPGEARHSGYLSAYPGEFLRPPREPAKPVWAPYYTLHKIYRRPVGHVRLLRQPAGPGGVQEVRRLGRSPATRRLTDEQMQRMLGAEHGGMNEVLANLYALDRREEVSRAGPAFQPHGRARPGLEARRPLTGLHANTQIPKFVGAARQYELTGDELAPDGRPRFSGTRSSRSVPT